MIVEYYTGTPEQLAIRLAVIIALPKTLNDVIVCSKGVYIILYT